jgi:glycosyltransferase involved in cell wall biosynthesis
VEQTGHEQFMTSRIQQQESQSKSARGVLDVLFLIDEIFELGGAERVLLRIIKHLPRERYSPRVVTFRIDERLGLADSLSCPLHVFPIRRTYDWGGLGVARQIREIVRSHNVQITHTFFETSDLWAGPIARMSGCPVLISNRRDMGILRGPKHRLAYKLLGRYFDEVHTVSEEVRQFCIQEDKLDPRRVVTIPNGVDFPPAPGSVDKQALRARFGLAEAKYLVVSVGHIRRVKGFDVFLQAAARVRQVMPEVTFAIAGKRLDLEESHFQELTALATTLGLGSRFVFLGAVDDVESLLRSADVFCLPSRSEGMSNALLEAMACELPCVATRVGGNPEVIAEGKTGYLVESEDADSVAVRILQLLRHPLNANKMGIEGRRVVEEKFSTKAMMRRLINSYERLVRSNCHKNL